MYFGAGLLLVVCIVALVLYMLWYQRYSRFFKLIHKIPGPAGYPLLGNYPTDYAGSFEEIFLVNRKNGLAYYPIYKQWILHVAAVTLLHPDDIEIVLSSSKHMEKSQLYSILHMWLGTGLLTSGGEKWKMRRRLLTPAFHFTILQNFVNIFNEGTEKFAEILQQQVQKDYIDVVPYVSDFTLKSMAETSMGISFNFESEMNSKYKKAIFDFGELAMFRGVRPWWYNDKIFLLFSSKSSLAKRLIKTLHGFTEKVIREKQALSEPTNNLSYATKKRLAMLDLLLKAKEEGADIDDDGIREEVDTFLFEGHDTTSIALCFIFLMLANHPTVQEKVRQEIIEVLGDFDDLPTYKDLQQLSYTERCIKECLRLYPSVAFIARNVTEDVLTHTGYKIPKGAMVHVHIFDVHRNPNLYPDPDKFDPDRFLPENVKNRHPFAFIPFSAGPRNCIGQKFAMLELKAVLCGILRKFILEPVDKPEDIVFVADIVLRAKNGVRVKFSPRNKS